MTDNNDILLDVKNLTFKRGERVIYDDISLSIAHGKVTAIMGPRYWKNHFTSFNGWAN